MPIFFCSKTPNYAWLSNFSVHPFTLDGFFWPTVEHFYQAAKYPGQLVADEIRGSASPAEARSRGQARSLTPRPDWKEVKKDVMRGAIEAKFSQNAEIRVMLLATGEEELVHESAKDKFWGRTKDGIGENWLGVILMEVRQTMRDAVG